MLKKLASPRKSRVRGGADAKAATPRTDEEGGGQTEEEAKQPHGRQRSVVDGSGDDKADAKKKSPKKKVKSPREKHQVQAAEPKAAREEEEDKGRPDDAQPVPPLKPLPVPSDQGDTKLTPKKSKKSKDKVKDKPKDKVKDKPKDKAKDKVKDKSPVDPGNNDEPPKSKKSAKAAPTATPDRLSPIRRHPTSLPRGSSTAPSSASVLRSLAPSSQPEVHAIGEIVGGRGFGGGADGLFCKWHIEYGALWRHVAGAQLGQTQVAYATPWDPSDDDDMTVWAHPIDLHLVTSAVSGWPSLVLQVWRVDKHMATHAAGYGFVSLPFAPGDHELAVSLWRPLGNWKSELDASLTGRTPELASDDVVLHTAIADRCRLQTVATGSVLVRVGLVLRNFGSGALAM